MARIKALEKEFCNPADTHGQSVCYPINFVAAFFMTESVVVGVRPATPSLIGHGTDRPLDQMKQKRDRRFDITPRHAVLRCSAAA